MRKRLVAATLLLATGCSGVSGDAPHDSTTTAGEVDRRPTAAQREVAAEIADAILALNSHPALAVTIEAGDGAGIESTVEAVVDLATPAYRSREELRTSQGDVLISEQVLIDGMLYARIAQVPEEPSEWAGSPVDEGQAIDLRDRSLLWFGAAGSSLERIIDLLESVPFAADQVIGDGNGSGYSVSFVAADVAEYFRRSGLEVVGPSTPDGEMNFEFWFDGGLTRLVAGGIQFHDGEAVTGQRTDIRFRPLPDAGIVAPGD